MYGQNLPKGAINIAIVSKKRREAKLLLSPQGPKIQLCQLVTRPGASVWSDHWHLIRLSIFVSWRLSWTLKFEFPPSYCDTVLTSHTINTRCDVPIVFHTKCVRIWFQISTIRHDTQEWLFDRLTVKVIFMVCYGPYSPVQQSNIWLSTIFPVL